MNEYLFMRIQNHENAVKHTNRCKHYTTLRLLSASVINLPKVRVPFISLESKMNGAKNLTYAEVVEENRYWIKEFGGSFLGKDNVKNRNLLQNAIDAPKEGGFEVDFYSTLSEAAAQVCYRIVMNHVFHDGNKRTSWAALVLFLEKNGYTVCPNCWDVQRLIVGLVNHQNTVQDLVWFIENHLEKM